MVDGFRLSHKRLAMVALGPLVTRRQEASYTHRTIAGRWASCTMERPLVSESGVLLDDEQRVDDEWLVLGIVSSEYVAKLNPNN